jgi:site-specific recombinase XerC
MPTNRWRQFSLFIEEWLWHLEQKYWFRHSHATLAIEGGCDLHLLQQSLGHSSLEITSKYLHARPNQGSSQFLGL